MLRTSRFIASIGRLPLCEGLLLCTLLLFGRPLLALPEDADQPIHIQADNVELDQQAQTGIYRGSVRVDQGTLRVTADEMIVEYHNKKVTKITASGSPAHYQQQLEHNEGQVRADATTIVYHTVEERLDLRGNAFLTQDGNEISGDYIKYDIVAGKVDAQAEEDGRVRMVLEPADLPE